MAKLKAPLRRTTKGRDTPKKLRRHLQSEIDVPGGLRGKADVKPKRPRTDQPHSRNVGPLPHPVHVAVPQVGAPLAMQVVFGAGHRNGVVRQGRALLRGVAIQAG